MRPHHGSTSSMRTCEKDLVQKVENFEDFEKEDYCEACVIVRVDLLVRDNRLY